MSVLRQIKNKMIYNLLISHISTIHHEKAVDDTLKKEVDILVDTLMYRISNKSFSACIEGLEASTFHVRTLFVKWLYANDLNKKIGIENHPNPQNSTHLKLAKTLNFIRQKYLKINNFSQKNNTQIIDFKQYTSGNTYKETLQMLREMPGKLRLTAELFEQDVKLETAILIAQLILNEQANPSDKKFVKELNIHLLQTIERYGAYAIVCGLWQLENIVDQLEQNMDILARTIEYDEGFVESVPMNLQYVKPLFDTN